MRNAPIVAGTPTPYFFQNKVWPSRQHGPIYTRPVWGFPKIARPQDVFTPGYNVDREVAQPTLSGLGAVNSSWDVGNGVFKPGGYGGGVFDGDISGLGSIGTRRVRTGIAMRGLGGEAEDYPWKAYSDKTKALQESTNLLLARAALCPIAVDGKLGPGTCGARKYLNDNKAKFFSEISNIGNPSTCQGFTLPASVTTGCGNKPSSGGGGASLPSTSTPLPVIESGMSSGTKRALGFALGGVLAIGAVVMLRKKR